MLIEIIKDNSKGYYFSIPHWVSFKIFVELELKSELAVGPITGTHQEIYFGQFISISTVY